MASLYSNYNIEIKFGILDSYVLGIGLGFGLGTSLGKGENWPPLIFDTSSEFLARSGSAFPTTIGYIKTRKLDQHKKNRT